VTFTLLPPPDSIIGSEAGQVRWYTRVAAFLAVASPSIRFDGADISHYQDDAGPIDWDALRAAGGWIAFKATQGLHYVDPTFLAHRDASRAHAFTHRIFYHWLDPNADPVAQAVHFLSVVGRLEPGEGVMLDVEQAGVTAAQVLAWCQFVESVTKRPVIVYTGAYVAGGTVWQSTTIRFSPYGPRPMHLAAYTTETRMRSLPGVKAYPWSGLAVQLERSRSRDRRSL
jgi:GH25 family lysozyme M1 (1,4-beta-N-acetylmuramidase)